MRIIFMGTPAFAESVLNALIQSGYHVVACYTQPDKPAGRKMKMLEPAVKVRARNLGISVHQPTTLRDADVEDQIRSYAPDMIITAAYGKILPQSILDIPSQGCLNVHASLLPKYRGAAPVQWALLEGEKKTGVTIMKMDAGMDTGDILSQSEMIIDEQINAATLMDELALMGAELLINTLPEFVSGKMVSHPQEEKMATYAPPIKKEQGRIDWNQSAKTIHNQIRALSIWPAAFTIYREKTLKIHCSSLPSVEDAVCLLDQYEQKHGVPQPGTIICAKKDQLAVYCKSDVLLLACIQPESCRRMFAAECAHNYKVSEVFGGVS